RSRLTEHPCDKILPAGSDGPRDAGRCVTLSDCGGIDDACAVAPRAMTAGAPAECGRAPCGESAMRAAAGGAVEEAVGALRARGRGHGRRVGAGWGTCCSTMPYTRLLRRHQTEPADRASM